MPQLPDTLIPFLLFMSVAINIGLGVCAYLSYRGCKECDRQQRQQVSQLNAVLEKHQRNEQRRQFPHARE